VYKVSWICLCGKECEVVTDGSRVSTHRCDRCETETDVGTHIYHHNTRYCKCNELVKLGIAEVTSECGFLCKNRGDCKCAKK